MARKRPFLYTGSKADWKKTARDLTFEVGTHVYGKGRPKPKRKGRRRRSRKSTSWF